VAAGEALLSHVTKCFFGPMRVSVMLDANGANTTASAAVIAAARHAELKNAQALVLAGTGPVGQRIVRLLAKAGAEVRVASRSLDRAREACESIQQSVGGAQLSPIAPQSGDELLAALDGVALVFAAGAAGVELLPLAVRQQAQSLRVAIDLNAVSPVGIAGIGVADKVVEQDGIICYGAVGVGGTKMKIHKAAIRRLFESNDAVLDADEIYAIGQQLEAAGG
jgi:NAD(P)-dependent dehydrogenase (short-subunit alcohol dehydrogenase family)